MSSRTGGFSAFLGMGLLVATAGVATAQQTSSTTTTQMGTPQSTSSTRHVEGTVVSVTGNKLVGRDASGKTTEYTIPDGFKFHYQGKEVAIGDLKPGMKVSADITTTTTTTPVTVTEIRKGTVLKVSGDNIIVRGPLGVRRFSNADASKHGAKIMRDGKEIALSDLREGDNFTAVLVTDHAPEVVSVARGEGVRQRRRSGSGSRPDGRVRSGARSGSGRGSGCGARSGSGQAPPEDGDPASARRRDGRAPARGRLRAVPRPPLRHPLETSQLTSAPGSSRTGGRFIYGDVAAGRYGRSVPMTRIRTRPRALTASTRTSSSGPGTSTGKSNRHVRRACDAVPLPREDLDDRVAEQESDLRRSLVARHLRPSPRGARGRPRSRTSRALRGGTAGSLRSTAGGRGGRSST